MSDILYSKLRLVVPNDLDGETATITNASGTSKIITMSSPKTDIMLKGLDKYRIQAGTTDEKISLDYGQMKKITVFNRIKLKKLPYDFMYGSPIILDGELHILGGDNSTNGKYHYKFNGYNWIKLNNLPISIHNDTTNFCNRAIVLDNELHIFDRTLSQYSTGTFHYKYNKNNDSWSSFTDGSQPNGIYNFVALEKAINEDGKDVAFFVQTPSSYMTWSYKPSTSTWRSGTNKPGSPDSFTSYGIYNNNFYLMGSNNSTYKTKMYNSSTINNVLYFYEVSYTGFSSGINSHSPCIEYKNLFYKFNNSPYYKNYKIYNGTSWSDTIDYIDINNEGSTPIIFNDNVDDVILLLGGAADPRAIRIFDGTSWTVAED